MKARKGKQKPKPYTFDEWFRDQFGPCRGGAIPIADLRRIALSQRQALAATESMIREREIYETRRDAALKAWTAKPCCHDASETRSEGRKGLCQNGDGNPVLRALLCAECIKHAQETGAFL